MGFYYSEERAMRDAQCAEQREDAIAECVATDMDALLAQGYVGYTRLDGTQVTQWAWEENVDFEGELETFIYENFLIQADGVEAQAEQFRAIRNFILDKCKAQLIAEYSQKPDSYFMEEESRD